MDQEGNLKGYNSSEYNIDHVNAGKVLFFAYEKTNDERYKVAIEHQMDQLRTHPRTNSGNFWHKKSIPTSSMVRWAVHGITVFYRI